MSCSPHKKAFKLQRNIFLTLKHEATLLLGKPPQAILKYERENEKDFRNKKPFRNIPKSELIDEIRKVDVTFIGDFHTLDQAQRTALRIMREVIRPDETWWIGLELVPTQFQKELDALQAGKISVESFLQAIHYEEAWGFPWPHYAPIFEWARQNQVKLIALNRPQAFVLPSEDEDLHKRDQWAAGVITDLFTTDLFTDQKPKMLVLYGELHVGSRHLPAHLEQISKAFLKSPLTWITLHQNNDKLYWEMAKKNLQANILSLKPRTYCVFSSTPWAKLQSIISWVEGGFLSHSERETDYYSIISDFVKTLSEFLGVPIPQTEPMSVYTLDQLDHLGDGLESLRTKAGFSQEENQLIKFYIKTNQPFYLSKKGFAYLGTPSFNRAAEMSAIHLFQSALPIEPYFKRDRTSFCSCLLESTFGFFGSLILNPRRKCDLPADHQVRISQLEAGTAPQFPKEAQARKLVLGLLKSQSLHEMDQQLKFKNMTPLVCMTARYLGQIFGKTLYECMIGSSARPGATKNKKVEISKIRQLFLEKDPARSVEHRAQELMELVFPIPIESSKSDRI